MTSSPQYPLTEFASEVEAVGEAFRRLLQAVRLERDAFVWMDFNDRATADALILVLFTSLFQLAADLGQVATEANTLLRLATSASGINLIFEVVVQGFFFWLGFAGVLLFVVRMLYKAPAKYPLLLRVVGFAYPTLLVGIFVPSLGLPDVVSFVVGSLWFIAVVAHGVRYESDLGTARSYGSVAIALVLLTVARAILSGLF